MSTPLIHFDRVCKSFGPLTVLDGVELSIERGLVTTIIGKSGVGKSVLLKHIVGLLEPDSGQILIEGRPLRAMSRAERKAFKARISYMFQNMALFDSMTVFENVALPLEEKTRLSREEIEAQVMAQMESLDLGNIAQKYPSQISGGMKKRVALARALITKPEVILFDEPTTGLDPIRKKSVHQMIARYQQQFGFTAVVVSHDIPEVFDISQKVALLEGGRILFEGTAEALLASPDPVIQRFIAGEEDSPLAAGLG